MHHFSRNVVSYLNLHARNVVLDVNDPNMNLEILRIRGFRTTARNVTVSIIIIRKIVRVVNPNVHVQTISLYMKKN